MIETEDFDWDAFNAGFDGEPPPPPCSMPVKNAYPKMVKELAFHEASHFVFDVIGERLKLGFSPINAIKISSSDPKGNFVRGGHSPFPKNDASSNYSRRSWYLKDKRRLYLKIFSLLAGYASYQVFIECTPYFINPTIEENENNLFNYHRIDCLPDPKPSDFVKTYDMLNWINQGSAVRVERIHKTVKEIMRIKAVKKAIIIVKSYLLKNVGRQIAGAEMNGLRHIVLKITKKVRIEKYFYCYENPI